MKKLSICMILLALLGNVSSALAYNPAESLKAEQGKLASAKTAKDSVKVLYNIFDLSNRAQQKDIVGLLYSTAGRAGLSDVQLDVARLSTAFVTSPEAYDSIINVISPLPESRDKTETILFLRMIKLPMAIKHSSDAERQSQMVKLMANFTNEENDDVALYNLFSIVEYLRNEVRGDLLNTYLDELIKLVNSDSFTLYALRNLILTEAAAVYTETDENQEALEVDRRLLSVIKDLKEDYHVKGRIYRDYSLLEFISLRRMMRNFKELSNSEISQINSRVLALAKENPDVEVALNGEHSPRYFAYYYSATGQYDKAIPLLNQLLETETSLTGRRRLLGMLIDASRETKNQPMLMSAMMGYTKVLEEINAAQAESKSCELRILYDVDQLKRQNLNLELEKQKAETDNAKAMMIWVIVAWAVCLIGLVVIFFYWHRYRRNVTQLNMVADHLAEERNWLKNLAYQDYDDDLSSGNAPEITQVRLGRHKVHNHSNIALKTLEDILNDLMYVASIGKGFREKQVMTFRLSSLINSCVDRVKPLINPGVNFNIETPGDDVTIRADRDCAEHVLYHLLRDSALYTDKGEINLNVSVAQDMGMVRFTVTDTGIPIESGGEEIMFENFIEMDKLMNIPASGMFLSRMAAFLLSSSLKAATKYTEGCKFTFIMPIQEP